MYLWNLHWFTMLSSFTSSMIVLHAFLFYIPGAWKSIQNPMYIRKIIVLSFGIYNRHVDQLIKAMEETKDTGASLSSDPNLRLPLWPHLRRLRSKYWGSGLRLMWSRWVITNLSSSLEVIRFMHDESISLWHNKLMLLLVKLGEKGCSYYTKVC